MFQVILLFFLFSSIIHSSESIFINFKSYGNFQVDLMLSEKSNFSIKKSALFLELLCNQYVSFVSSFNFIPSKVSYVLDEIYFSKNGDYLSFKIGKVRLPEKHNNYSNLDCYDLLNEQNEKGMWTNTGGGFAINLRFSDINFFYYLIFKPKNNKSMKSQYILNYLKVFLKLKNNSNLYHLGINFKDIKFNTNNIFYVSEASCFNQSYSPLRTYPDILDSINISTFEFIKINKSFSFKSELNFIRAKWRQIGYESYMSYIYRISYMMSGIYATYNFDRGIPEYPLATLNFGALELIFKHSNFTINSKNNFLINQSYVRKNTTTCGINLYFNKKTKFKIAYVYESYHSFKYKLNKNTHGCVLDLRLSF